MSKVVSLPSPAAPVAVSYDRSHVSGYSYPGAGELVRMREGLGELLDLLSYARPHNSDGERVFIRDWLLPRLKAAGTLPLVDFFGNVWATVAAPADSVAPAFLWSCHIDTVHSSDGRQRVQFAADGRTIELVKRKAGRCLGADDGAGLWLMLEMIRAGIAGTYVFHRGEEVGRLGSEYVAKSEPERLEGFDCCVAFDRRDFADLITHQMGERCASEAFASSFAGALNKASLGLAYVADDTGSYTDSYSYAGHISECCNLSVGYDREHGPRETLDGLHLWRLREAMLAANLSGVAVERDAGTFGDWYAADDRYGSYANYSGGWGNQSGGSRTGAASWRDSLDNLGGDERSQLKELVREYPAAAVDLMLSYGLGLDDMLGELAPDELSRAMSAGIGEGPGDFWTESDRD
jgi:hypothetical protein